MTLTYAPCCEAFSELPTCSEALKIIDETNAEVLRPSDRDIINNAEGNNLTEVIDKLITNRMFAGDFILDTNAHGGSAQTYKYRMHKIYGGNRSNNQQAHLRNASLTVIEVL